MDWTLMAFIGVCAVAASSGALFPPGKWYDSLRKPSWRPPNWLFGPAWMVLYAMIAVSGWLVWTTAAPGDRLVPMTVYGVQLALNAAWSGIFFGMKRMKLALGEMALLWLSIAANIAVFWPVHQGAALLLVPYLAWVAFAFTLNRALVRLNPQAAAGAAA
jgi:tryptophan-rich sensory protein